MTAEEALTDDPDADTGRAPRLFTPLTLRGVALKNRIVISPMQQYAAGRDGLPTDYHLAHYGRLAMGGAGLVFTEALCISPEGRLTYSDLGSWDDACVEPLGANRRHRAEAGRHARRPDPARRAQGVGAAALGRVRAPLRGGHRRAGRGALGDRRPLGASRQSRVAEAARDDPVRYRRCVGGTRGGGATLPGGGL